VEVAIGSFAPAALSYTGAALSYTGIADYVLPRIRKLAARDPLSSTPCPSPIPKPSSYLGTLTLDDLRQAERWARDVTQAYRRQSP